MKFDKILVKTIFGLTIYVFCLIYLSTQINKFNFVLVILAVLGGCIFVDNFSNYIRKKKLDKKDE